MNIFKIKKQNYRFRLTCTSITSRKLHLKSSRSSNFLQKPHTEPILCSDCIPIVVFDNPEEDNCSNTIDDSSARLNSATVHYTTQNDFLGFPVPLFIANIFLSVKNRFRRSNLQKKNKQTNEKYQGFFVLKPREYRSFRRSIEGLSNEDRLMVMTTDQLL